MSRKIPSNFRDTDCQTLLHYTPTPIQEVHDKLLEEAGVRLLIKREDLNHPFVSGNKWWKLKYNLEEAAKQKKPLLTFGGAYSNHLYATGAAARELGFESIGIVRGEETLPLNSTLSFVKECGMNIQYISREAYRKKNEEEFIQKLHEQFGDFYRIPEGGTNDLAVKGCAEFAEILNETKFDYLCLPVGTGGTMAGILSGIKGNKEVIGFSVLKGGDFLVEEITELLRKEDLTINWKIVTEYHCGGYAKTTPTLIDFKKRFEIQNNVPLDLVYTAKMMLGVYDLISKGHFKKGSTILAIHTGGLQANL